jgi:hypothetical protein
MWTTRLPHEVRLVSIINMAGNERYGSVLGMQPRGGGVAHRCRGSALTTMIDRRWTSNGGAGRSIARICREPGTVH